MGIDKFTPENCAILFIDFQTYLVQWIKTTRSAVIRNHVMLLLTAAKELRIPVVFTSCMEDSGYGPLLAEFNNIFPSEFGARINRSGEFNAMNNVDVLKALKNTNRKNIVICGISNDICTAHTAIAAFGCGYNVQVVVDAGGAQTTIANDVAVRRMEQSGIFVTCTNQLVAELANNCTSKECAQLMHMMISNSKQ